MILDFRFWIFDYTAWSSSTIGNRKSKIQNSLVGEAGIEPATTAVSEQCSTNWATSPKTPKDFMQKILPIFVAYQSLAIPSWILYKRQQLQLIVVYENYAPWKRWLGQSKKRANWPAFGESMLERVDHSLKIDRKQASRCHIGCTIPDSDNVSMRAAWCMEWLNRSWAILYSLDEIIKRDCLGLTSVSDFIRSVENNFRCGNGNKQQ